jgi:hypothetical protein
MNIAQGLVISVRDYDHEFSDEIQTLEDKLQDTVHTIAAKVVLMSVFSNMSLIHFTYRTTAL